MYFSLFLGLWCGGLGQTGLVPSLVMQHFILDRSDAAFTPHNSKMKVFETDFFDYLITENDHPTYVKHFFGSIYVVFFSFTLWMLWIRFGYGEGVPEWFVHKVMSSFSPALAQKLKFSRPNFFYFVITKQPMYSIFRQHLCSLSL